MTPSYLQKRCDTPRGLRLFKCMFSSATCMKKKSFVQMPTSSVYCDSRHPFRLCGRRITRSSHITFCRLAQLQTVTVAPPGPYNGRCLRHYQSFGASTISPKPCTRIQLRQNKSHRDDIVICNNRSPPSRDWDRIQLKLFGATVGDKFDQIENITGRLLPAFLVLPSAFCELPPKSNTAAAMTQCAITRSRRKFPPARRRACGRAACRMRRRWQHNGSAPLGRVATSGGPHACHGV